MKLWKLVGPALVFISLAAVAGCSPDATTTDENSNLVGTWRFERYSDAPEGMAPVYAFGVPPIGFMIFTADGQFSVSLMRNPPATDESSSDPDPDACIPVWYCSYFGPYTVDDAGTSWMIDVQGGNIPGYLGTEQSRSFVIRDDTLIISEQYVAEGRNVHAERVLVRQQP